VSYESIALHRRPRWQWPNGARLAVWVIPNVEAFDAEAPIDGVPFNTFALADRDYGNRVGFERIRALLESYGIRPTAAVNARIAVEYPDMLEQCIAEGWELMGHGDVNNRRLTTYAPDEEGDLIGRCLQQLHDISGIRPQGWLSPGLIETANTLGHLVDHGITYVADHANDDQPCLHPVGDGRTIVSLPYSTQCNDKAAYDGRMVTPDEFANLSIRQFDRLYDESGHTALVYALAVHPYLSGVPHRMAALERIVAHIAQPTDVWLATGSEIVDAYREACPT
jgi:peptidoglycan/xylan/chitin deacetylase (PgdA/CDA1 family)